MLPIGGFTRPVAPSAFVDSAVAAAEQEELVLTGESVEGSDEECHEECVEVEVHAAGDEERDEDAFHMEVEEPGALDDAQIFAPISSSTPHEPPARDEETPLPEAASRKRKLARLASSADSLPRSPTSRCARRLRSPARRGAGCSSTFERCSCTPFERCAGDCASRPVRTNPRPRRHGG